MNGPVAIAGSMPRLFKNNGTNVPIKPATIITTISDTEIAIAVVLSLVDQTNKNKNRAKIAPFSVANNISFINLLLTLPFTSSFAKPCTIMALDCTPTFPAIAAIKGVKKNKTAYCLKDS